MVSAKPHLSMKKPAALMAVGLLVFALYLYFFVGFGEILDVLKRVDPVTYFSYYSLTVAAILLSILFYSMAWYELLRALSLSIGLRKAFTYSWIGNFVDLVIPIEAVSGELTKIYLLQRNSKENFGKIVASVVSHRVISNFATLSGLTISSLSLILSYRADPHVLNLLIVVLTVTATSIITLFYLSVKEDASKKLVNALIRLAVFLTRNRLRLSDLTEKAQQTLSVFHQGIKTFGKNPKFLIKPIVYTFVSWSFHVSIYFLVFYALGFTDISPNVLIIVYSVSMAVQAIPISLPAGLVEVVMTSLYVLFGIPSAVSGTATALIRAVTFWLQILVGYIIVQWIGIRNLLS